MKINPIIAALESATPPHGAKIWPESTAPFEPEINIILSKIRHW